MKIAAACLLLVVSYVPTPARTQEAPAPEAAAVPQGRLAPGAPVERELAGGGAHAFEVALDANAFCYLVVEQNGVDVVLRAYAPDGAKLQEADQPNGLKGPERVAFVSATAGVYRLEVRSLDAKATPGRYAARVEQLRPAAAGDEKRVEAMRLDDAARLLVIQRTPEARRGVVERYTRAAELWHEIGDFDEEAMSLNEAGLAERSLSRYPPAVALLERAVAAYRAAGDRKGEGLALNNLGFTYDGWGEKPKALEYYTSAAEIYRAAGEPVAEARALANRAETLGGMGEREKALELYVVALERLRAARDEQWIASTLHNLGATYFAIGEYQLARSHLEEALPLWEKLNRKRGLATTLNGLGNVHRAMGDVDRALEHYNRSLAISQEQKSPVAMAVTLNSIATVLLDRGEAAKAVELLDRSLRLLATNVDREHEARSRLLLGKARVQLGDRASGADELRKALELARAVLEPHVEIATLTELARLARDAGDLDAAQAHTRAGLAVAESVRVRAGGEEARAGVLGGTRALYDLEIDLLVRRQKLDPSGAHTAAALHASERARARALVELLAEASLDIRRGAAPELLARERLLQQRLVSKAEYQTQLLTGGRSGEKGVEAEREMSAIRLEYEAVQQQIRQRSPRYAALTQPEPLTLAQIRDQVLDPATLLLEYALGDERSFVWVVSKTDFACVELPPRREIEASARRVHELLAEPSRRVKFETAEERAARVGRAEAEFATESARLAKMLIGPVVPLLGTKRLLVVPDGALQYVPFSALPDPRREGGTPLVVSHVVVTAPSATTLAVLRRDAGQRPPAAKALAIVADPVFTRDDPRVAGALAAARPAAGATRSAEEAIAAGDLPRLAHTRKEAQAIAGLVPEAERLQVLDFDANRTTLMGGALSGFRIVHIATHGYLNASNPALSGLLLSKVDAKGQPRDGLVLAHEIYGLDLSADLVVLSACRTGLGKEVRGEGILGLTRGFMYAGARGVVVSLWSVDDEATAALMSRFYEGVLKHRRPPAAALRAAQVAMWNEGKWRFPYYWAAFVLQGE